MIVTIQGQECFEKIREAAEFVGCSYQTIWRYTDTRQPPSRQIRLVRDGWKRYIPISELKRFMDEIRPTFKYGGRYGRPKGAKDKKPRKTPEQPQYDYFKYLT